MAWKPNWLAAARQPAPLPELPPPVGCECGQSTIWLDPYGARHCVLCDPLPEHPAMVRGILALHPGDPEPFWFDLREEAERQGVPFDPYPCKEA